MAKLSLLLSVCGLILILNVIQNIGGNETLNCEDVDFVYDQCVKCRETLNSLVSTRGKNKPNRPKPNRPKPKRPKTTTTTTPSPVPTEPIDVEEPTEVEISELKPILAEQNSKCSENGESCNCNCCSGLYCIRNEITLERICVELERDELPPNECRPDVPDTALPPPNQMTNETTDDIPGVDNIVASISGSGPPSGDPNGGSSPPGSPGIESIPVLGGIQSGGGDSTAPGGNKPNKPGKPNGKPGKPNKPNKGKGNRPTKPPASTPVESIPVVGSGLQQGANAAASGAGQGAPPSEDEEESSAQGGSPGFPSFSPKPPGGSGSGTPAQTQYVPNSPNFGSGVPTPPTPGGSF